MEKLKRRLNRNLVCILTPHRKYPSRTIFAYLMGLMWAAVLGNFVYDLLGCLGGREAPSWIPFWTCVGAVLLLIIGSLVAPVPKLVATSSAPEEVEPRSMKGLILLLSFYSPRGKALSFDKFAALLNKTDKTEEDWKTLEESVTNSNVDVPVQAIRYHLRDESLRRVWLICTDDAVTEGKIVTGGSWRLAPYLERFIRETSNAGRVQFHYHKPENPKPNYLVNYFGEQSARDAFSAVDYIFEEEVGLNGLEPHEVICDFTGGRSTHTVGMVLACLPAQRRIQYTSSPQTPAGDYVGRPRPREIRADTSWVARLVTLQDLLQRYVEEPSAAPAASEIRNPKSKI